MGQKVDHVDNSLLYLISLDPDINQFHNFSMNYSIFLAYHRVSATVTC